MKLLLFFLLLCSCGKKNELKNQSLNFLDSNTDRDGDGVTDMEEVSLGRNHLIADINTNHSITGNTFTLVDGGLNEFQIRLKPRRLIRTELLRKALGLHQGAISDINKLSVDFNSSQDFWKLYHSGQDFYRYHFKVDKSQSYPLPGNFEEKRSLEINNFSDYGILDQVKTSTYRLIISTSEKEMIYYLHPSIAPISFLKTEHGVHFNHNGPSALDLERINARDWVLVSDTTSSIQFPRAGKTYAVVSADKEEYQESAIISGIRSWETKIKSPLNQRIEKTLFIPTMYEREILTSKSEHAVDVGEYRYYCYIKENLDQGFKPFIPNVDQIRDWLNPSLIKDATIHWSYSSYRGITIHLSGNISKYSDSALLNAKVRDAAIGIGVTETNCNFSRPNVVSHPLYTGHKEYYLAD